MSSEAQQANLARIRNNQRRSRARRREYLAELEQRLRLCELQGVEASAEVQMAARRVADENRQLRGLLQRQGISDEYITHYLQAGASTPQIDSAVSGIGSGPHSSHAVHALQQSLAPRRPASLDAAVHFPVAAAGTREGSLSASTAGPAMWDTNTSMAHYSHSPQTAGHHGMPMSQPQHGFQPPLLSHSSSSRSGSVSGPAQSHLPDNSAHQQYDAASIAVSSAHVDYSGMPLPFYAQPAARGYEPRTTC